LIQQTKDKRIYGCEEVTIGFDNGGFDNGGFAGRGKEIVDFMTMDSKGIIKCYEIKITLQDLKSDAKKSWFGHYNYLVITQELFNQIDNFSKYIPSHIGVLIGTTSSGIKAIKQEISTEQEIMLKESLVRSIYFKLEKHRNAQSLENIRKLQSKVKKIEKEKDSYYKRAIKAENIICTYEEYMFENNGIKVDLEQLAKDERDKFWDNMKKSI
jgi:hypothetical protein